MNLKKTDENYLGNFGRRKEKGSAIIMIYYKPKNIKNSATWRKKNLRTNLLKLNFMINVKATVIILIPLYSHL